MSTICTMHNSNCLCVLAVPYNNHNLSSVLTVAHNPHQKFFFCTFKTEVWLNMISVKYNTSWSVVRCLVPFTTFCTLILNCCIITHLDRAIARCKVEKMNPVICPVASASRVQHPPTRFLAVCQGRQRRRDRHHGLVCDALLPIAGFFVQFFAICPLF